MLKRKTFKWRNASDEPAVVDNMAAFDSMLNDIGQETEPTTPQTEPATQTEPASTEPPVVQGTEPDTKQDVVPNSDNSKSNHSFAQMRITNKNQQHIIERLSTALGLDATLAKNPEELLKIISEADAQKEAEDYKTSPELMKRLQYLEQKDHQTQMQQNYQNALGQMQAIKAEFNLTNDELKTFVSTLEKNNIDPFTNPVDLKKEFVSAHYDMVVQKQVDAAIQAYIERDNKAAAHSTAPATQHGKAATTGNAEKITTLKQFDAMLREV